jgi:hypothetical protein
VGEVAGCEDLEGGGGGVKAFGLVTAAGDGQMRVHLEWAVSCLVWKSRTWDVYFEFAVARRICGRPGLVPSGIVSSAGDAGSRCRTTHGQEELVEPVMTVMTEASMTRGQVEVRTAPNHQLQSTCVSP